MEIISDTVTVSSKPVEFDGAVAVVQAETARPVESADLASRFAGRLATGAEASGSTRHLLGSRFGKHVLAHLRRS